MFQRSVLVFSGLREFLWKQAPSVGHKCEMTLPGSAKPKLSVWHGSYFVSHTTKTQPKLISPLTITLESGYVGCFWLYLWSTTTKTISVIIQSFISFIYKEAAKLYQRFFGPGNVMNDMKECLRAKLCKDVLRLKQFLYSHTCANIFWLEMRSAKKIGYKENSKLPYETLLNVCCKKILSFFPSVHLHLNLF